MGSHAGGLQSRAISVTLGQHVTTLSLSQAAMQSIGGIDVDDRQREQEEQQQQQLDQGGLIGVGIGTSGTQVPWRNFEEARAFVRSIKMTDQKAWRAWSKSGSRPHDIPSHPDSAYSDTGWLSWRDWLGTSTGRPPRATKQKWKSFTEARDFVRELHLDNQKDWRRWSSLHRPSDIPSHPHTAYKASGWLSWRDWLGTAEGKPPRKSRVLVRKNKDVPLSVQGECLVDDHPVETDPVIEIAASFTNTGHGSSVDGIAYQAQAHFINPSQDRLQDEEPQCWIDMGKKEEAQEVEP